ncbi:V-type proton ATPase subunit e 2-like [Varroa jacobsoni]|uniref:V-type proton ATPase subunit n=1 Tax=Varroa destructor TaxID=109461 RepID=A0A7M7KRX1_VARDE|nr:V-type proton ATPase subunit e 2-like [Varroa destructor]XP_022688868.1 V-type proton ATPase subunit e 2-like [Varroa jacobsoni]
MGAGVLAILFFTIFWGLIGIVVPIFIPRRENRPLIQVCISLTAVCCYVFWLCTYMAQMNPLIGPMLTKDTLWAIDAYWGGHDSSALVSASTPGP